MSRIGKTPVVVPQGVTTSQKAEVITVVGPKGTLSLTVPVGLKVKIGPEFLQVETTSTDPKLSSIFGLFRSLMQNSVVGVTKGWEKTVELVGVGYRASGGGNEVTLNVGFTHPVKIVAPVGISFTITDNTKVTVSGMDKKVVGEVTAQLRAVKPPEPYKGKGVRYLGEVVRKKAGKAVKAAGAPA